MTLKFSEAADLIGVSRSTLCSWVRGGLIREVIVRDDAERCRRIDLVALLSACLMREYRARLWSWAVLVPIAHYLRDMNQQALESEFEKGRNTLAFVPGSIEPRLVVEGERIDEARDRRLAVIAIPIKTNWEQLLSKLPTHVERGAAVIELMEEQSCEQV